MLKIISLLATAQKLSCWRLELKIQKHCPPFCNVNMKFVMLKLPFKS